MPQRPVAAAELRLVAPAEWPDRFRAFEALDHTQRDPLLLHQKMVATRSDAGITIKWLKRHPEGTLRLVPENKAHPIVTLLRTPHKPVIALVAW